MNLATLCATIATRDELEQLLVEQAADADRLRALNAELLAALQAIYDRRSQCLNNANAGGRRFAAGPASDSLVAVFVSIRAMIAKAQP